MSVIADLLAWLQGGLQGLGEAVSLRVREEPVLTVGLFRAAVTMLVGFGLGWTGEQVALMVAFIEAVTAGSLAARSRRRRALRCPRVSLCAARRHGGDGRQGLTDVDGSLPRLRMSGLREPHRFLRLADHERAPLRPLWPPGLREPLPRDARPCRPADLRLAPPGATEVEAWVAVHGWTCPGWHREPHPVRPGDLAADHPEPLVLGGEPLPREPGVLCSSCNARKGLSQRRR